MNSFEEKFLAVCRTNQIDPYSLEGDIARVFFYSGIKYALHEPTSTASLLTAKKEEAKIQTDNFVDVKEKENSMFLVNYDDVLTQADVQRTCFVLKTVLNSIQKDRETAKRAKKMWWEHCNPEDPNTLPAFESLNAWKDAERDMKEFHAKLSEVQRKMKKLQKAMV